MSKNAERPVTAGGRTLRVPKAGPGVKPHHKKATWFERNGKKYGERAVTRCYSDGEEPKP